MVGIIAAASAVVKLTGLLLGAFFFLFPLGAMIQERKVFRDVGMGPLGCIKVRKKESLDLVRKLIEAGQEGGKDRHWKEEKTTTSA